MLAIAIAIAVSDDGSVIVGAGRTDTESFAIVWDPIHGARRLKQVLEDDFALDLTGWTLVAAQDVSGDGQTIVGSGKNPDGDTEAWMAVPEPSALSALGSGIALLALLYRRRHEIAEE